ncbi:MAG: restriction endonuclease subunit S [Eubacterium sp.]|nr:restriction endonuclease subunit S [Eubacterium sp.]
MTKLSKIADYSKGQQINGDELIADGEYDYLNGGINPSGKWNSYNVCANTVTISEGGNSSGYINYMEKPFWCGAHCYYLYNVKGNSKYLYYALKSQQDKIMQLRSGACMPNIKKGDLGNFELNYSFDDKEQKHIAAVLDKVTDLIAKSQKQLELLDELVKARFVEMFGDPILNPNGWDMATIGDIVTEVKYGTSRPAVDGGKYPYLRMNNLTFDGHLDLTDLKRIDIPDHEIEKCIVRKGDVLFNRTNSVELVGKTCVFNESEEMVIAGYIIRVRLKSVMLPITLSCFMNTHALKEKLKHMAKGAVNQANINAQELQAINIYLPPFALQQQFSAFVEQTNKSKTQIAKSLEQLETLKKALMQKYFG